MANSGPRQGAEWATDRFENERPQACGAIIDLVGPVAAHPDDLPGDEPMKHRQHRSFLLLPVALFGLALLAGAASGDAGIGPASAAVADASSTPSTRQARSVVTVTICVHKKTGRARVVTNGKCKKKERMEQSVSVIGEQGAQGAQGAQGEQGPAATLTCATGGTCAVGDTGPGGGTVFYAAGTTQSWGRYLEAAPSGWYNGGADPTMKWCNIDNVRVPSLTDGSTTATTTASAVGTGWSNTAQMISGCLGGPANLARAYHGGGKADWFLPSQDELDPLYDNRNTVGGFTAGAYWSSTEFALSASDARALNFATNAWASWGKASLNSVRPIRAF